MLRKVLLVAILAAPAAALAGPDRNDVVEGSIGSDRFVAGSSVGITGKVEGDAFAAGAHVTVDGPVAANAFLAGAHVEVRGGVGRNLYAAGASVAVSSSIGNDGRLAGDDVEVSPTARFGGDLSMAGQSLSFAGTTGGNLRMIGRDAIVSGTVGGDLEVEALRIELQPGAHIAGKLRYRSDREPVLATGAQVLGGVERLPATLRTWDWRDRAHRGLHGVGRGVWLVGSFVLGLLLLLAAPTYLAATSRAAVAEWPLCLGIGFAILIGMPVAAVVLLITLIGIPLALLVVALYALVLLLGYVVGAVAVGDLALARLSPARASAAGWRICALLGALVLLGLVRNVPLVGGIAVLLVFLTGVGALSLRVVRPKAPAAAS